MSATGESAGAGLSSDAEVLGKLIAFCAPARGWVLQVLGIAKISAALKDMARGLIPGRAGGGDGNCADRRVKSLPYA